MLELQDVSLFVGGGESVRPLLADVSMTLPRGHFTAVVGPSGCGKSTLLKLIAGVAQGREEGRIAWNGQDLVEKDFSPSEIGYVPQFSIAHEELTVRECVETSFRLRVRATKDVSKEETVDRILSKVGLMEPAERLVRVLSGGQKRRLALAMELVSAPSVMLCDEVTSGLDPQAEDEIVKLLDTISHDWGRLVLSVTHSLRHLDQYDSVAVLYRGVLAYHGPPKYLSHYFRVSDPHQLFGQLEKREPAEWHDSWRKYRSAYEVTPPPPKETAEEADADAKWKPPTHSTTEPSGDAAVEVEATVVNEEADDDDKDDVSPLPGPFAQFLVLLQRRWTIFLRTRAQLFLQIGLIVGFPLLVAVFAWNGLPQIQNLSMGMNLNVMQQLVEAKNFLVQATSVGSLVSGIVMFQVILLTLMGANNSGREIAGERLIFEKERLAGVRPGAYIASKAVFLGGLVLAQSLWMGLFVHFVCGFPGQLGSQLLFLLLVNAAMTSVCLAISSWMGTAEQASLVSIYLVGFQLPLSGAVLALPTWLGEGVRPFIAAYWSWSGTLQTLRGERYYDIIQMVAQTKLSPEILCMYVLVFHVIIGLLAAWMGCQRPRWE